MRLELMYDKFLEALSVFKLMAYNMQIRLLQEMHALVFEDVWTAQVGLLLHYVL